MRAHTHTHVTFRKRNWKRHTTLNVVACAGTELAAFWVGKCECHSHNCHDDAGRRLGVKAAFCIQNGAGFPVPHQCNDGTCLGMGPQIFGSHLQLKGALLWGFYDIVQGWWRGIDSFNC